MGCTNPNPKPKTSALPDQAGVKQSTVSAPAEPVQVPKITAQEAQRRRNELRKNLEQGKCNPPKIRVPKIQAIQTQ